MKIGRLAYILYRIFTEVIKIAVVLTVCRHSSKLLAPLVYAERGYEAVGGEWLLIIAFGIITYYLLTQLMNALFNSK
ncbi:MAG: hypothetical protein LBC86_05040 [Oscillospiraceae bacterium]|jgi:hypothetical protein|nr:hypothetical protein [Oscillospiraceae bacterium]